MSYSLIHKHSSHTDETTLLLVGAKDLSTAVNLATCLVVAWTKHLQDMGTVTLLNHTTRGVTGWIRFLFAPCWHTTLVQIL